MRVAATGAAVLALAGCGSRASPPPAIPGGVWVANAYRFVDLLETDAALAANGGSTLAAARAALANASDLYTTLVAYDFFGSCDSELAAVGTPSGRELGVVRTLAAACSRLRRASALFHLAVARNRPALLVRASAEVAAARPLLGRARRGLARL